MPITRRDVTKNLFNAGDSSSKIVSERISERNKRPPQKDPKKGDVLDLDRMSSSSFMALLGEGTSSGVIKQSKAIAAKKKRLEQIKFQNLANLNNLALHPDNIDGSDNEDSDAKKEKQSHDDLTKEDDKDRKLDEVQGDDKVSKEDEVQSDDKENIEDEIQSEHNESQSKLNATVAVINEQDSNNNNNINDIGKMLSSISCQTAKTLCLCTCEKCRDILGSFSLMLKTGSCAQCEFTTKEMRSLENETSKCSIDYDGEEFVPLYKGSKIKITITIKAKLRAVNSDQPKDYASILMSYFFTDVEAANMTAEGRTKGSTKMKEDVKDAMFVYLCNKFEKFEERDLNEIINAYCYSKRRKLWNTETEGVRGRLQKHKKKATEENNEDIDKEKDKGRKGTEKSKSKKNGSSKKRPDGKTKSAKSISKKNKGKGNRQRISPSKRFHKRIMTSTPMSKKKSKKEPQRREERERLNECNSESRKIKKHDSREKIVEEEEENNRTNLKRKLFSERTEERFTTGGKCPKYNIHDDEEEEMIDEESSSEEGDEDDESEAEETEDSN